MTSRTASAVVAGLALALALCGCAPSSPDTAVTETPTATTATPAPTAEPETAAIACDTVLDQTSLDDYAAKEYQLSDDFAQRAIDQGWPTAAFVTSGGLLCQWGYPQSDASEYYGFAEITPDEREAQVSRLIAEGFTRQNHADGELFTGPVTEGVTEHYLFAGDHWFVGFSTARIDEIRGNAGLS